jgi:hypothetical protein
VVNAHLGDGANGGGAGRGSENKTPFVAAVSLDADGHPPRAKLDRPPGFPSKAIPDRASAESSPKGTVTILAFLSLPRISCCLPRSSSLAR